MATANFYLKKDHPKANEALIILQMKYSGVRLVFSTKQKIEVKNWNAKKQRVKNNNQATNDGLYFINDLLDNLSKLAEKTYVSLLKKGIPTTDQIKEVLTAFMNKNNDDEKKRSSRPTLFNLIDRFISGEITVKGAQKSKHTLKTYRTVKTRLLDFQEKVKYPVDFETINLDFFYKYVNHLSKPSKYTVKDGTRKGKVIHLEALAQNSKAKNIQVLKTFMSEGVDLGYTNNLIFKHRKFSVSWEEVESVCLTRKEVLTLFRTRMEPRLERIKDIFVVGCCTALRYSDFSTIKPEYIVDIDGDLFIRIFKTQKTKESVIIPCDPIVMEIFDKYAQEKNRLPRSVSNQKMNEYIKEACREAGLTEKGRLQEDPEKELCDCISSHTARRTCLTNLYLEGFPIIELMKISGHRKTESLLSYLKVSKLDAAKKLADHFKKQREWQEKLSKAEEEK
ncbi:MAG TPA: site-specific integrase [Chitinophagaceae bacterium]|jgi:integrase